MRKIAVFITILIMVIGFYAGGVSAASLSIFSGTDWVAIDEYKVTSEEKQSIKESLVKAVAETTYFNSTPVITYEPDMSMKPLVEVIDKFYKTSENRIFPLYFAIKLADMELKKAPESTINNYKIAVIDRLKKTGFLK